MSLAEKVSALAARTGAEIKAVRGEIAALPGGSAILYSVTLDFGSVPVPAKTFEFDNEDVTTTAKIVMTCAGPADGRSLDEMEMDMPQCAATCLTHGIISVVARCDSGLISGQYKFNYLLG